HGLPTPTLFAVYAALNPHAGPAGSHAVPPALEVPGAVSRPLRVGPRLPGRRHRALPPDPVDGQERDRGPVGPGPDRGPDRPLRGPHLGSRRRARGGPARLPLRDPGRGTARGLRPP